MMDLFFEIHSGLPREGPGDDVSTARALGLVRGLPTKPDILDIGCGPGAQTLVLARECGGLIAAVDNHVSFLDDLRRRAARAGLSDRVRPVEASMFDLPFEDASFDLIWSEGAIYIMGFDNGLRNWRRLLRPGGWVGVSEACWLRDDPPPDLLEFWMAGYPGIRTIAANLAAIHEDGYELAGHFVLPESSWRDAYYAPITDKITRLKEKYRGNAGAMAVLDQEILEMDLYRKYSAYYGYVFFVMKKTDGWRPAAGIPFNCRKNEP